MLPEDVILKPVLTEKATDGIADKRYTFVVAKTANKTQIKIAVEAMFNVRVKQVNTVNRPGKLKRMGRNEGYTPATKKAIVTLTQDSKAIEFFSALQ